MNTNNTELVSIIESINDDYEYIQYNEQLRIIHSIKDDMYQMQSIIKSCHVDKRVNDWFRNQTTQELLNFASTEISADEKLYENRTNLPNELRGMYIHHLLVNHVAIWSSPSYSWNILKLLENYFKQKQTEQKERIDNLTPRAVPRKRETDYKYLIWKEIHPKSKTFVVLHLVRRHKDNFRVMNKHLNNPEEKWFYRENFPISMSPNNDIKRIIRQNFGEKDVRVHGNDVIINVNCLDKLHELVQHYFDNFQLE